VHNTDTSDSKPKAVFRVSNPAPKQNLSTQGEGFPGFFNRPGEWADAQEIRPYLHHIQRAWETLGLSAVFCVEGKPTVYFKSVEAPDPKQEAEWQKVLWNQATAAMLVVEDPKKTRIYSALAKPDSSPIEKGDTRWAEDFETAVLALEFRQFLLSIQTGKFYQDRAEKFRTEGGVDQYLLDNLSQAREELIAKEQSDHLEPVAANAFLGRCLFTCYLIEREVIGQKQFAQVGATFAPTLYRVLEKLTEADAVTVLFGLFRLLDDDFNGSMFGKKDSVKKSEISPRHVTVLRRLLRGDDLRTSQPVLFDLYDFRFIPIELISSIYENFIVSSKQKDKPDSESKQRKGGSYYTPPRLAELVVDIATEGWDTLLGKRYLDPACGSGIFLVILFQRMAAEWCRRNSKANNVERARELRDILTQNLCGVDVDPTACMVTCFSLYLAFLDQLEPKDIWELKDMLEAAGEGKVLPPLDTKPGTEQNDCPVILEANFFGQKADKLGQFHLVIGNPPWVGRNQPEEEELTSWLLDKEAKRNPYLKDGPKNQVIRKAQFFPQKQSAIGYLWKVPVHVREDGFACMLLPSRVILSNQTDAFQAAWFRRFSVDAVWQLADYSFVLFAGADCPAIVMKFRPISPAPTQNIAYFTPKVERLDPRRASILVSAEEQKILPLADLFAAAGEDVAYMFWKMPFWGTDRDRRLLDRLRVFPILGEIAGEVMESKRWVKGQGFQAAKKSAKKPKPVFWEAGDLYLDANNTHFGLFLTKSDCGSIGGRFQALHRPRSPEIYKAPLVIINQGFSRFAFSEFDVLFQAALQSIAGQQNDKDLLLFLTAFLNSPLATYFLFHTSANWGVERDKVHFEELLQLPFPLPENTKDPAASLAIIRKVATRMIRLRDELADFNELDEPNREQARKDATRDLNEMVYQYFDLSKWERALVEDTCSIFEPSSTPASLTVSIPTLEPSQVEERKIYAELVCQTINRWARRSGYTLVPSTVLAEREGLALLTLDKTVKGTKATAYVEANATAQLRDLIERVAKASVVDGLGGLRYLRGFAFFEDQQVHILKPLARRHWTRTAALNDADELAGFIAAMGQDD
jgi:hypothetical protein